MQSLGFRILGILGLGFTGCVRCLGTSGYVGSKQLTGS